MAQLHKKDVIVSVTGCRLSPNPRDNRVVDMVADGSMVRHPQGYTVSYREPFESDKDTRTTLFVEDGRVTIMQSGGQSSQMVFEEGRRHVSYCDTAEGPVTMGITANRVKAELGQDGGHIEVDYGVEIAGNLAEASFVHIDIRAASGSWLSVPEGLTVYKDYLVN